jgi:hypothetical protein
MFAGKNKNDMKSRFAMDLKARCVAELHQTFKAHKGQLIEVKKHALFTPLKDLLSPSVVILAILRVSFNSVVHGRLYSVSFPITASSAKFAVQCPLKMI